MLEHDRLELAPQLFVLVGNLAAVIQTRPAHAKLAGKRALVAPARITGRHGADFFPESRLGTLAVR
jgi:hypothetical protein